MAAQQQYPPRSNMPVPGGPGSMQGAPGGPPGANGAGGPGRDDSYFTECKWIWVMGLLFLSIFDDIKMRTYNAFLWYLLLQNINTARKGEVNELRQLLRTFGTERDKQRKREIMKKVIAYMTLGIGVSRLFTEMMLAIESEL